MLEFADWCIELKIKELTVFAFAIDNFNRTKEEVDALMDLIRHKLKSKEGEKSKLMKMNIKVSIIGNKNLLENDISNILSDIEKETENNTALTLNICVAYNFTDEKEKVKEGLNQSNKDNKESFQEQFENNLYLGYNLNCDMLIRTSGEHRLSNFLLYQCRFSNLYFFNKNWVEIDFYDFGKILLNYHMNYSQKIKDLLELGNSNNFSIIKN